MLTIMEECSFGNGCPQKQMTFEKCSWSHKIFANTVLWRVSYDWLIAPLIIRLCAQSACGTCLLFDRWMHCWAGIHSSLKQSWRLRLCISYNLPVIRWVEVRLITRLLVFTCPSRWLFASWCEKQPMDLAVCRFDRIANWRRRYTLRQNNLFLSYHWKTDVYGKSDLVKLLHCSIRFASGTLQGK